MASRLQTRIGIATGVVVVGDIIGSGAAREESIVGETPNLAARLQTLAEPNTVVVSEATCRLLGARFRLRKSAASMSSRDLPSRSRPGASCRRRRSPAVSRRRAPTASAPSSAGRRKWACCSTAGIWRSTARAKRSCSPPKPGMGKSRLVEALFERIGTEPHRRIVLQCSPYHSNTAFYPVMRQIEHAAGFVLEDSIAQKLDKLDALLGRQREPGDSRPLRCSPILLSLPAEGRYAAARSHAGAAQERDDLGAGRSPYASFRARAGASRPGGRALDRSDDARIADASHRFDRVGSRPRHRHGAAGIRIALGRAGIMLPRSR